MGEDVAQLGFRGASHSGCHLPTAEGAPPQLGARRCGNQGFGGCTAVQLAECYVVLANHRKWVATWLRA